MDTSKDPWPLFGRHEETAMFDRSLQRALSGQLSGFFLSGPPGIGKTRLAEELAGAAANGGFLEIRAAWREDAHLAEYWVWKLILRRLLKTLGLARVGLGLDSALSALSVLIPEIREDAPGLPPPLVDGGNHGRARLFEAVCGVIHEAAQLKPLAFILDNLHLAGPASLDLLAGLMNELPDCRLVILATFRDIPASLRQPFLSFLSETRKDSSVWECTLDNLHLDETTDLISRILGRPPPGDLAREIHRITGGNPLFVRETAQLCRGNAERPGGTQKVSPVIGTAIEQRLRRVSRECREVLRLGAVIGEELSRVEVDLVSGSMETAAVDQALEDAVAHGFLHRLEPGRFGFSHSVVREAIRSQTAAAERGVICATLAENAERAGAPELKRDALRLAGWWSQASGPEARAKERVSVRNAAETAIEESAWEEAIELLGRLEDPNAVGPARSEEEAAVSFQLGRAQFRGGNTAPGIRQYQRAFEWYRGHGRVDRMIEIATQEGYLNAGEPGYFDFYEQVLDALPPDAPPRGAILLAHGTSLATCLGDYAKAEETIRAAYDFALRSSDSLLHAQCLVLTAFVDNRFSRHEDALRGLDQAWPMIEGVADPYVTGHYYITRAQTLIDLGRSEEAAPLWENARALARRMRDAHILGSFSHNVAGFHRRAGEWQEARACLDDGLAAEPDYSWLLAARAMLEYHVGGFEEGDAFEHRLGILRRRAACGPYVVNVHWVSALVARAKSSGDARALPPLVPLLRAIEAHPAAHPLVLLRAHLLLALIAFLLRNAALAGEEYDAIIRLPRLYTVKPYYVERALGLAAGASGRRRQSVLHLEEAARLSRHYRDGPMEGWILCELGEARINNDPTPETAAAARRSLVAAMEKARALGMPTLERQAADLLGRVSELRGGKGDARFQLTRREKEVLDLASKGRTNRQIAYELSISANTVANHLRSILDKTGAANRTEAADLARRGGASE